ncbi:MAG TPA: T9SS type A sorting domain-containing protein [Rubricoccaceae bacterium]|nr:T9SS type A sorting domain-containing protein [Rubricoccaceae bacterium]
MASLVRFTFAAFPLLALLQAPSATAQAPNPCFPAPSNSADYFPFVVGTRWTYNYFEEYYQAGGQNGYTRTGTYTIQLLSVDCGPERATYTVLERWQYDGGGESSWNSVMRESEAGQITFLPSLASLTRTFPRYGPASGPSSLLFNPGYTLWCGYGSGSSVMELARDIGMTHHSFARTYMGYRCVRTLNLTAVVVDAEPPAVPTAAFGLRVFPNPARDAVRVTVSGRDSERVVLDLLDVQGREVRSFGQTVVSGSPIRLDVRGLPSGSYFLRATSTESRMAVSALAVVQ